MNLMDLIAAVADTIDAPQSVTINTRDGGISLHWIDRSFELAVYGDHYESYQFSEGETLIRHWPHAPGDQIDAALLEHFEQA